MKDKDKENELLIEHLERCWKAECENAERHHSKLKMMGTIAAAVLGLGLYKLDWLYTKGQASRIEWPVALWTVKILLVLALIFVAYSFYWIMKRTPRGVKIAQTASILLLLNAEQMERFLSGDDDGELSIIDALRGACLSLARRNARLDERIRWSTRWFFLGILFALLAVIVFVLFSVPPL